MKHLPRNCPLNLVTLTGADDDTTFEELEELVKEYSFIEFAILFSKERQGTPRYPTLKWIEEFVDWRNALIHPIDANISLHLCGKDTIEEAFDGVHDDLIRNFERVQLNFRYSNHNLGKLAHFMDFCEPIGISVITQENSANDGLCGVIVRGWRNYDVLHDASGGRGVSPESWKYLETDKLLTQGFAGGLGPDNVKEELVKILEISEGQNFWIDMETKLRDANDKFSVGICRTVCEQVWETINKT